MEQELKYRFGEGYARGNDAYEKCPRAKYEMNELNKIIYAQQTNVFANETTEPYPFHDCKYCKGRTESAYIYKLKDYGK